MSVSNNSPDFIQISLGVLRRFSRALKFDIYVKRAEGSYTKIFKKGDVIDWERVQSYAEKGIKFFYVTPDDYAIYTLYVERLGEQLNVKSGAFTPEEAADTLKELAHYTMHEMTVNMNVDERAVGNAHNVVNAAITSLSKEPKSLLRIMKLMANQPYIMKHSVSVSMLSVLLAKAAGMESETNLQILGMGAFLHDIGVGQLTFDPDDKETLSADQRKEMWRHPELGKQMLDGVRTIRSEVLQIVMQHHEQPNGAGYPNGLRGPEIYYPAKIVAIADTFAAMISTRSWRPAFSVEEAITRMRELKGKYDKKLLDVFARMLMPSRSG